MTRSTTIGIIGTGVIATQVHLPILAAMDDVEVAWIADANSAVASSVAAIHGLSAVPLDSDLSSLPHADVVLIAIPLPPRPVYLEHYRKTTTALLIEKPLANSAEEHRRILAAFAPWQLSVGYQRRHYGSSLLVRSFIETGTLGPLRAVRVSEGGRTTRTDGAGQYQSLPVRSGGGIVKNLGCHALDLALWLTGATGFRIRRNEVAWDDETDQRCRATIELDGFAGHPIELEFALSWIDRMENRIEFRFDGGLLSCPIAPTTEIELLSPSGEPISSLCVRGPARATTPRQAYYLEWRSMLDAVASRSPQPISAGATLLCAELIDALLTREPVSA